MCAFSGTSKERSARRKKTVLERSTNFYASNLELGSVPPVFIHQLGRSRWIIDTTVFQTMTTDAHLKRPSVHQDRAKALIVLTMIRVLAYTLTLAFFFRQVRSHFRNSSLGFLRPGAKAGRLVRCSANGFQLNYSQNKPLRALGGRRDFLPPAPSSSSFATRQSSFFSRKSSRPSRKSATRTKISSLNCLCR